MNSFAQNVFQLSADLSDPLFSLLSVRPALVDAVEIGPWFTLEQARDYRRRLPSLPFHFHAADLIEPVGIIPSSVQHIGEYLAATDSPWVSAHISVWQPGDVGQMKRGGHVPLPDPETGARRLIGKARQLAGSIHVPLLLENVEPLPFDGYDYWARPEFIRRLLQEVDCGFLLDTGHARIAAETFGMDVKEYLRQLPLERVAQIHVSGPRRVDGRLLDHHAPLEQVDYELLGFLLAQVRPAVVTLEYIQDADLLDQQLSRLRQYT